MPLNRSRPIAAALLLAALSPLSPLSPTLAAQQDRSALELHRLVNGLTVTPRVLIVGMHPDDEPSELIAWLSRGRRVETAYLSVTRGEAGESYGGLESGSLLGAVRTQEALAARRLDGAKQFYTRAYDFGFARNTDDVLKRWNRDSVIGDIVAVIRSFRPHVVVAMLPDSTVDGDGQHQALALFADHAFTSSNDPQRFPPLAFGAPWPVAKLFRPGPGVRIDAAEFDRAMGKTYADLALEARAEQRSQGLIGLATRVSTLVDLRRIASRVGDSAAVDQSLFGAVDTTFARLAVGAPARVAAIIPRIIAYADSARRVLDSAQPSAVVPYLVQAAYLASAARAASTWCRHPSSTASPAGPPGPCNAAALDLEASIDLLRERSVAALLIAAGISFDATVDRELLAQGDTAAVTVTMVNRGGSLATLLDVALAGRVGAAFEPIVVPADGVVDVKGAVAGLGDGRAWWVGPRGGETRGGDRFEEVLSAADGLSGRPLIAAAMRVPGAAVPEDIRRASDATVTLSLAGITVTTSLGPLIYRHADAMVGLQDRPLGGVPDVTLQFTRGLDWIPRNKPVTRDLRIAVKSHSDRPLQFDLKVVTPTGMPKGLRVDSLPPTMRLEPREQRELLIRLRGKLVDTDRAALALIGIPPAVTTHDTTNRPATHAPFPIGRSRVYQNGLRIAQRSYLPPVRLFPSSGEWLQPIDMEVPSTLTVLYVPGVADDMAVALKQVGVWVTEAATADQLLSVDLSRVKTVAIGPLALEAHPELLGQTGRLHDFVRNGGTLVVLRGDAATATSRLFPFPIALARPIAERVTQADVPVTVLDPNARLLTWPNRIATADWAEWVGPRALNVPSVVDPRYARLVETHDPDEKENRNAVLVGRMGKGTIVYTTLTLDQQIAGGVPGALRLLVNLLSAGLAR